MSYINYDSSTNRYYVVLDGNTMYESDGCTSVSYESMTEVSSSSMNDLVTLLEYRRATIAKAAKRDTPNRVVRSKSAIVEPVGVVDSRVIKSNELYLIFKVKIGGTYKTTILIEGILDYVAAIMNKYKMTDIDQIHYQNGVSIVALALKEGDIRVSCTCDDFRYRFAYKATDRGYNDDSTVKETRPAKITNPNEKGSVCKHILAVLDNNRPIYRLVPEFIRYLRKDKEAIMELIKPMLKYKEEVPKDDDPDEPEDDEVEDTKDSNDKDNDNRRDRSKDGENE